MKLKMMVASTRKIIQMLNMYVLQQVSWGGFSENVAAGFACWLISYFMFAYILEKHKTTWFLGGVRSFHQKTKAYFL